VTPRTLISAAAALALGLAMLAPAHATITFVNGLALPGSALDLSGGTTVNNGRVGYFSDIYYDTNRNEWWGLSDRGPGGGTLDYGTRMHRFTLDVDLNTGAISNYQLVQTVRFTNGGLPMNGIAPSPTNSLGNAFDPEGIVVNPRNGNFLVSDEYGPSLYEFDRNGNKLRAFTTPAGLIPRNGASSTPNFAGDTGNTAGKRTNRGFEGLAISPDGQYAFAMLQSAMLDEGGGNGTLNRIVKFDTTSGLAVGQYAYQMKRASQGQGISALVAINDHEFFVLERNNLGLGAGASIGSGANVPDKEVYKIDLTGATDVTGLDLDAPGVAFSQVVKGAKVIDLDANTLDLDGNGSVEATGKTPEKWEGLAIGPRLNDGSHLILAGNDNDYSVTQNANTGDQYDVYFRFTDANPYAASIQCPMDQTTGCFTTASTADTDGYTNTTPASLTPEYRLLPGVLHAYKASSSDLMGYTAAVPEPESYALLLAGLGAFAALRRRAER
jgi:hypothetical protein